MKNKAFIMTDEVTDERIDNLVRDLLNCPACRTCKRENKKAWMPRGAAKGSGRPFKDMEKAPSREA